MNEQRNDLEIANETMVMIYLNILKYAKHHCAKSEDPWEVADRVFTGYMKALMENNQDLDKGEG